MYAAFRSIGAYVPERILSNEDLTHMVDTTDEWITKRTGIKERRIAAKNETTSDMAVKAAELAIERSGLEKSDIDMIVMATISPDYFNMPSTATVVAHKMGLDKVPAFDISAACTGFVYILGIAKAFIESGMKKNILIVGSEKMSAITDYTDRGTCMHIAADGSLGDFLMTPDGGTGNPHQNELKSEASFIQMKGNETFKIAVRTLTKDVVQILADNNLVSDDIAHFVPHQANYRIIKAVGDALKMREDQVVLTVHKYGNTSGASIPMAINDLYEEGGLKAGEMMLLDAFGGGLTWGSALVPFSPLAK